MSSVNVSDNNETSGVWQAVRDISSDPDKLMLLAKSAHNSTKMPENDVISWATFDTTSKYFSFHNYNKTKGIVYEPMRVDMVTYAIQRLPKCLFHFTKGIRDGCVLYLVPWDEPAFRVVLEYCNVEIPK